MRGIVSSTGFRMLTLQVPDWQIFVNFFWTLRGKVTNSYQGKNIVAFQLWVNGKSQLAGVSGGLNKFISRLRNRYHHYTIQTTLSPQ